jgi:hypothetical protein
MKHILFFIFLKFHCLLALGQAGGGFSHLYSLGDNANFGSHFSDVLIIGDSIKAFGSTYTTNSVPYLGGVLATFDTLGNLEDRKLFRFPNDHMLTSDGNNIVQRKSGGYAGISNLLIGRQVALSIFDEAGNILSNKGYGVKNILTLFARRVLEMPDGGFLIGGFVQTLDYSMDNFIIRINPAGHVIWSNIFGETSKDDILLSIIKTDNNNYVIGGGRSTPPLTPLTESWGKSWIFAIDSMGLIKWEWFSPLNAEVGALGLQKTEDNGWIYMTATHELVSPNTTGNRIKVVRRDSSFNLIWEKVLSPLGPGQTHEI